MLPDPQKLLDDAMKLPTSTRAKLVGRLLETLDDGADEGVEEAWQAEISRRVTELDQGKVKTVPWEDVRRELRARTSGGDPGTGAVARGARFRGVG